MNTSTSFRSAILMSLLLLLGTTLSWAEAPAVEKKKEVNQSFAVGSSDQLRIENIYGNVTVVHWDKNEVAIRVVIEAKANNDKRAQEIIDRVSIAIGKSGNTVSAITSLKSGNIQGNKNESISINYFITMPSALSSSLSQKYGNISLPEKNDGKYAIEVQYGNLKGGSFTAHLALEAQYSNVDLKDLNTIDMEVAYAGGAKFGNATTANIESRYSNLEMKDVRTLNLEADYGGMKAGRIGKAQMELSYSNGNIAAIDELLAVEISYGTLDVKNLSANFTNVAIEGNYANVILYMPSTAAFTLTADDMKYGNLDIELNAQTKKEDGSYRATVNGGSSKTITFDGGGYSNLKIRKL